MRHPTWHKLSIVVITNLIAVAILLFVTPVTIHAAPALQTESVNVEIQATNALSKTYIPQVAQLFPAKLTDVVIGESHLCGISESKDVYCWGDWTATTQDQANTNSPQKVDLGQGTQLLGTSDWVTCALLLDGTVKCWGYKYQPPPIAQTAFQHLPADIMGWEAALASIAVGDEFVCALLTTGTIQCISQAAGELQPPQTITQVDGKAKEIKAGGDYVCVRLESDAIQCWKQDNSTSPLAVDNVITVQGIPEKVISFDASATSCAVTEDGNVWCWNFASEEIVATQFSGLVAKAIDVSTNYTEICALLEDGRVQCWTGVYDQLQQHVVFQEQPHLIPNLGSITKIAVGQKASCAIQTNGVAKCWGDPFVDFIGESYFITSPQQVYGLDRSAVTVDISNGSIDAEQHSCLVDEDHTAKCWGKNTYGQLGDGTNELRLAPVTVKGIEKQVASIELGAEHTCAILLDGSANCWGNNYWGQIGDGTQTTHVLPQPVQGITDTIKQLALGKGHSCALLNGGGVQCWGENIVAMSNSFTETYITRPAFVTGLSNGVKSITAGINGTEYCALMDDGAVRCWGYGYTYQDRYTQRTEPITMSGFAGVVEKLEPNIAYLEDGTLQLYGPYTAPETIDFGQPIINMAVSFYGDNGCALLQNKTLQCWWRGQRENRSEIFELRNAVQRVVIGHSHACALLQDGSVQCWGDIELLGNNIGKRQSIVDPVPLRWRPAVQPR